MIFSCKYLKSSLLIATISYSVFSFAQTHEVTYGDLEFMDPYSNGLVDRGIHNIKDSIKDGKWRMYWVYDSKLKTSGSYKNGERDKVWFHYNHQGFREYREEYKAGIQHGRWVHWGRDTKIIIEKNYNHGILNGVSVYHDYHMHGRDDIKIKEEYKKGILHGITTAYFENSVVFYSGNYTDGKKNGTWITNHENGKKKNELNYSNGQKLGSQSYWYNSGQIRMERQAKKMVLRPS